MITGRRYSNMHGAIHTASVPENCKVLRRSIENEDGDVRSAVLVGCASFSISNVTNVYPKTASEKRAFKRHESYKLNLLQPNRSSSFFAFAQRKGNKEKDRPRWVDQMGNSTLLSL